MPFDDAQSFGRETPRLEYPSFWTFRVSSSMIHVSTELNQIRTPFDPLRPPRQCAGGRQSTATSASVGVRVFRSNRPQSLMSPDGIGPKQMDRQVDVLVVGAGPTGSTAAKYAALGGADVLMIEKRSEIGTPVRCGEGVAKRWLEEIGLTPSREFICHEVDGARIIAPDGTTLVLDETRAGNECGYILERDLFDRFLAREAAKAGAEIMIKTSAVALLREDGRVIGARCEHMGDTFDVRADVVIGADGFESQVGRWAGLETHLRTRDIDACLQYTLVGVDGDPRLNDFYLGSCAAGATEGNATEEVLRAYDAKWRGRMEEELARHYLIKERLIRVDDETINKVLRAVSEIGVEQLSTPVVLDAIRTKYPEVLKAFDGLL